MAEHGYLDAEMTHNQDVKLEEGMCDRRKSLRVKGKVYKTVVRPAMMYGADTWAVKISQEK